jgi:hypothetical protein
MATAAQILANQANAAHSTGPRTEAGKAATARNATTHGFTTGVFQVDAEDKIYFDAIDEALREDAKPAGALENDAIAELRDAFFRLRQIRKILAQLNEAHGADPLVHPDTAAAVRQLNRYRAAAEMQFYRAIDVLMDLQLLRVGRMAHLTASEEKAIGPMVDASVFASQQFGNYFLDRRDRERFYRNLDFVDWYEAARLAACGVTCEPDPEAEPAQPVN